MYLYNLYSIIFFTIRVVGLSQDFLVKKDSSRLEIKLLEASQTEIKYKLFNYQEGPIIIINKNDIAYVVYQNGIREVFNTVSTETTVDLVAIKSHGRQGDTMTYKIHRETRVGDYIKFNFQLGAVINSLESNYTIRKPQPSRTSPEEFSASSNKYVVNYNLGFNFLFGKSLYIKHVIGVNYLRSSGEYKSSSASFGSDGYSGLHNLFSRLPLCI
ncbi:MAG: hypothetical protein K0R26_252 [Bacteroidota bacterium]|nr:hypothetical protein [Bacteroidota bacterium]